MSLMIVMIAISTSLVLTCAFLRTQATVLQISRNGVRRDLALEAAQTGAAVALERLQSPSWGGVTEQLTRVLGSTSDGRTEYRVRFEAFTGPSPVPAENALTLVIRSTGIWQSAVQSSDRVERQVETIVQLQPRTPGRPVVSGDSASAEDIAANPSDFDQTQTCSLFAAASGDSLTLDPGDRVEGRVWLYDALRLCQDPSWSSSIRRDFLNSVGSSLVTGSGSSLTYQHPHPLAGDVQFYRDPSSSIRDDLQLIRTPWSRASSRPSLGSIDHSLWRRYRLYAKGFEYQAVELGSTLRNVTLRPTPENPLGIFHRTGNLRLDDNVTVQGTLVVTGNLQIDGDLVHLAGYNWRNDDGNPIASRAEHWPRLPAIVAYSVGIDRECRVSVQGAIVTQSTFAGAGGDYELMNVSNVSLSGTATCRRLGQPLSLVQLSGTPNLASLNNRGDYSIWLDRGSSGDWYTIVGVDSANRRLTIIGEVDQPSAVGYRIARSRRSSVDLFGPLAASTVDLNRTDAWASLTILHWLERQIRWDDLNDWRRDRGLSPIEFVDWLATPGNWSGWWYPLSSYGLPIEPTFHLRPMTGTTYRWSPPIFEPYDGSGSQQPFAGYRWKVLSWREAL